jgi:hypothetical protein
MGDTNMIIVNIYINYNHIGISHENNNKNNMYYNNNMIHAHPVLVSLFCDPNVTLLDRASLCFINFPGHAVGGNVAILEKQRILHEIYIYMKTNA